MPEFIENPRRAPRAPVRCEARVALRTGRFWAAPTVDYGPRGCQLVAPAPIEAGARVFVELVHERVQGPFELSGRVAWASLEAPWRCGIAFDDGAAGTAAAFFERLAAAHPGLDAMARAPDRVGEDDPLAPAPPPSVEALLLPEERHVLRTLGAGCTAAALRAALGDRWDRCVNPLFALLGRGYVAVRAPDPAAAAAWAPLLAAAAAA